MRLWLYRWMAWFVGILALLGGWITLAHPERLFPYLAVVVPLALTLSLWSRQPSASLPILPAYLLMQALVYASPLLAQELTPDSTMRAITVEHLQQVTPDLFLWFIAIPLGWWMVPARLGQLRPASAFAAALDRIGAMPALLVSAVLLINLYISSDLYWAMLGFEGNFLLSPLRTLSSVLLMVGSFTGAYAWGRHRLRQSLMWLLMMLLLAVEGLSSLLLSVIQLQAIATMAGLWLGRSRKLMPFTLCLVLLVSLLQAGKVDIRERYWNTASYRPPPFVLIQEWIEVSLNPTKTSGSLFGQRLNGLSNLVFVEDALQRGRPTLDGATFALIPQALTPRIVDPRKGRSHEGQVLLNLHFGRQRTRLDTERAYIAWGLLPESIGNYGSETGPLLVGLIAGALIRLSENIGRGQLLLSTPGLASVTLLFAWVIAYESAASTFVASVFQNMVVVVLLGWWLVGRRRATSLES